MHRGRKGRGEGGGGEEEQEEMWGRGPSPPNLISFGVLRKEGKNQYAGVFGKREDKVMA